MIELNFIIALFLKANSLAAVGLFSLSIDF